MMVEIDEDDWSDVERLVYGAQAKLTVSARLCVAGKNKRPGAQLVFRGAPCEWLLACGSSHVRAQIAGDAANFLRLIPCGEDGFKIRLHKSVVMLRISPVPAWPAVSGVIRAVQWQIVGKSLMLELPADFAKPGATGVAPPVKPLASPPVNGARVIDRRPENGVVAMGEPAPGRSALDRRAAGKGAHR